MTVIESTCDHCGERVSRGTLYCDDCENKVTAETSSFGLKILAVILVASTITALALNAFQIANVQGTVTSSLIILAFTSAFQLPKVAIAYGAWKQKQWTYSLGMTVFGVLGVLSFFTFNILSLLFYAGLMMYLRTKKTEIL